MDFEGKECDSAKDCATWTEGRLPRVIKDDWR